jgi:hypothetical protein
MDLSAAARPEPLQPPPAPLRPPPAPPQAPVYAPPPMMPAQPQFVVMMPPPGAAVPGVYPHQVKAKSRSGCGCLIVILIIVGIVIAIGANSESRITRAEPRDLPSRPVGATMWNLRSGSDAPAIVSSGVSRNSSIPGELQFDVKVRNGEQERVLVAVYLLDGRDELMNWSNSASAGEWVEASWITRKTRSTSSVTLTVPVSNGPAAQASRAQVSLFNSSKMEIARQMLTIPPPKAQ